MNHLFLKRLKLKVTTELTRYQFPNSNIIIFKLNFLKILGLRGTSEGESHFRVIPCRRSFVTSEHAVDK